MYPNLKDFVKDFLVITGTTLRVSFFAAKKDNSTTKAIIVKINLNLHLVTGKQLNLYFYVKRFKLLNKHYVADAQRSYITILNNLQKIRLKINSKLNKISLCET